MAYTTRRSLLNCIKNGEGADWSTAWSNFYFIYTPLIRFCGRKQSLAECHLDDLVQDVMRRVLEIHLKGKFTYDPARGRFRTYLGRIIWSAIADFKKKNSAPPRAESAEMPEIESEPAEDFIGERDWQQYAYKEAKLVLKQRVSEDTYQAYEMLTEMENEPAQVSEFLNMPIRNVYDAKARCIKMLKEIIHELEQR